MRIIRTVRGVQAWRKRHAFQNATIGLVPTMGALHRGHESLIRRARRSCNVVVVSIFVNPLQFGPREDYSRYPRTVEADAALCRQLAVDLLFVPELDEFYPPGFQTTITLGAITSRWEGAVRPTHFQGVATVVAKLFHVVQPHAAFFGQKDYQQYLVIRQMAQDLNLGTKIVLCPTMREKDGLALSSRNRYLTPRQRSQARLLHKALQTGKLAIVNGERSVQKVQQLMQRELNNIPNVKIDYLGVCDSRSLEPLRKIQSKIVLLGAMRLRNIRLIDNLILSKPL